MAAPASSSSGAPAAADPLDTATVIQKVQKALFTALPWHAPEQLVDLLEFIAVSHSGSSFNADNTEKAIEIAAFVKKQPFAVSATGVASLAKLARCNLSSTCDNAQARSEGNGGVDRPWYLFHKA